MESYDNQIGIQDRMELELQKRRNEGNYRTLKLTKGKIDFSSNDYLGLSKLGDHNSNEEYIKGSTGSRLLNGNHEIHISFERYLTNFFDGEEALLTNSGYAASLSLLSSVPKRNDLILYDELVHSCIKDGSRLSFAKHQSFRHNDLNDLEKKLNQHKTGQIFVIAESIYSMDGDECPLRELVGLKGKYDFNIILDEAHSTGLYEEGKGLANQLEVQDLIFARIFTFGKAIGRHGASIVGSEVLKKYLINFARSFIYTTAIPPSEIFSIKNSFQNLETNGNELRSILRNNISTFRSSCSKIDLNKLNLLKSESPIQPIIISDISLLYSISKELSDQGFDVRPIFSPTVKSGTERLRVVLHSFNTEEEIIKLSETLLRLSS